MTSRNPITHTHRLSVSEFDVLDKGVDKVVETRSKDMNDGNNPPCDLSHVSDIDSLACASHRTGKQAKRKHGRKIPSVANKTTQHKKTKLAKQSVLLSTPAKSIAASDKENFAIIPIRCVSDPSLYDLHYILTKFISPFLLNLKEKKYPKEMSQIYRRPFSHLKTFVTNIIPLFLFKYILGGMFVPSWHHHFCISKSSKILQDRVKDAYDELIAPSLSDNDYDTAAEELWQSVRMVDLANWLTNVRQKICVGGIFHPSLPKRSVEEGSQVSEVSIGKTTSNLPLYHSLYELAVMLCPPLHQSLKCRNASMFKIEFVSSYGLPT
jgi:hypothetical protein